MKLLMITRRVDRLDSLAGFAYDWVRVLAQRVDRLYIIAWQKSFSDGLPSNVTLISLSGPALLKILRVQGILVRVLPHVSGIFCHMNPEYTIICAPLARLFGRFTVAWYTHKAVSWRRRLLELMAHRVITASSLSFREPWFPHRLIIAGHGIDTKKFIPAPGHAHSGLNIVSVGRISPIKRYEIIIEALAKTGDVHLTLKIIGGTIVQDQRHYLEQLKSLVRQQRIDDRVQFKGWISHSEIIREYQRADLFISVSGTGSVDKVVLEAMSCECPVITSNEAFQEYIPEELFIANATANDLAEKIIWFHALSNQERQSYGTALRQAVRAYHSLDSLADTIVSTFRR